MSPPIANHVYLMVAIAFAMSRIGQIAVITIIPKPISSGRKFGRSR